MYASIRRYMMKFLSYYPLKQGLKHHIKSQDKNRGKEFLSYYPLKQGLKLTQIDTSHLPTADFYPTIH